MSVRATAKKKWGLSVRALSVRSGYSVAFRVRAPNPDEPGGSRHGRKRRRTFAYESDETGRRTPSLLADPFPIVGWPVRNFVLC
jgi:hypothetical protein